jgi:murein DD-endopeptidase MepM/ murein hydrolase activator NlpD
MKKKIILFSLITVSILLLSGYSYWRGKKFICPIKYSSDIVIRCDDRGEGLFAEPRSGGRLHNGIDLYAKVGTTVLSSRSGRVLKATRNKGMGKFVVIRHRGGYTTVYGHLDKILVRKGQYVRQGRPIGKVGKTGNARYADMLPHLHFELRKWGKPQDPLIYIVDKSKGQNIVTTSSETVCLNN